MTLSDKKRNEIIEAALKVCAEQGFERAKVRDIARAAGIGKGTIYEYFASKEELFAEMLRVSIARLRAGMEEALAAGADFRAKLLAYARFHHRFLNDQIDTLLLFSQFNFFSETTRRFLLEQQILVFRQLAELVEEGVASGQLRADVDREAAVLVIVGTVGLHSAKKVLIDADGAADYAGLVDTIINGLR
ncbi:MAG: TetR/AcrR family transcriptional regulator [bacterium]|jgi:AcrR family transcriptional regulator